MSSLLCFILVVVIPIWGCAAIAIRGIEAWGERPASGTAAQLATPEQMARRIAVLEDVLNADKVRVKHEG